MERCRDGDGEGEIRMGYCGKEMDRLKKNFEMGLEGFDLFRYAPGYTMLFGSTPFASTKMILRGLEIGKFCLKFAGSGVVA